MKEMSRDDFLNIIYVPDDFNIFTDLEKEYLIFNYLDNFSISKKNKMQGLFSNEKYSISEEQKKHKQNCRLYMESKNYIEAYFELVYFFRCCNNNYKKIVYLNEILEISNLINDFKFNLYNEIYNKIDINALVNKLSYRSNITIYIEDFLSFDKTKTEKAIIFENNYLKVKMNEDIYEFKFEESVLEFKKIVASYANELLYYSLEQEQSNNPKLHKKMLKNGYIDCIAGNIDGISFNINSNCLDSKLIEFSKMFRKEIWDYIYSLKRKLIDGNENNIVKEIVKDLSLKLTGDLKSDYSFLKTAIENYKEDKLYTKILIAINNKIYEILKTYAINNKDRINKEIDEASDLIFSDDKNYDEGIKILMNIVNEHICFEYYDFYNLCSFDENIDYYFYEAIYNDNKLLKRIDFPFTRIYYLLAFSYIELHKYDEALNMCLKSLKWNPINIDILSEMFFIYKNEKDVDNINKIIDEMYKKIYKPEDLSFYYKTLGNYYLNDNIDLSYTLYYLAYKYFADDELLASMVGINDSLGRGTYKLSDIDIKTTLEKNHIAYGPYEKNIQMLLYIYSNNKKLVKNYKDDALISKMLYTYTGLEKYSPLNKKIDKQTGIKILYPRSYRLVKGKNMFNFYTDNDAYIQIASNRVCTKDQYNNIASICIDSVLNDLEYKFEIINRSSFSSDVLENDFNYQYIVFETEVNKLPKKIFNMFLVINNLFIVCSVDLKNDYENYNFNIIKTDQNVIDLLNLVHYMIISNK